MNRREFMKKAFCTGAAMALPSIALAGDYYNIDKVDALIQDAGREERAFSVAPSPYGGEIKVGDVITIDGHVNSYTVTGAQKEFFDTELTVYYK